MFPERVSKKIEFELQELDNLLETYRQEIEECLEAKETPVGLEIIGVAGTLQSFYQNLERIFAIIVKEIDEEAPTGGGWHKKLLMQVSRETDKRPAVISKELKEELDEYLGFRHVQRNIYSHNLKWEEFEHLVIKLEDVKNRFKKEVNSFL